MQFYEDDYLCDASENATGLILPNDRDLTGMQYEGNDNGNANGGNSNNNNNVGNFSKSKKKKSKRRQSSMRVRRIMVGVW